MAFEAFKSLLVGRETLATSSRLSPKLIPPAYMISALFASWITCAAGSETDETDGWVHGTMMLMFWASLPDIPEIVSEWASLMPLTVYLSDTRTAYDVAGEVSLSGKLSLNLAPKLWELGCIAKLLRERETFLDTSSAKGDPLQVYDVQWGSIFPCYNSAAAASVASNACRSLKSDKHITRQNLENKVLKDMSRIDNDLASFCSIKTRDAEDPRKTDGRRQRLDVIRVLSTPRKRGRDPPWQLLRHLKTSIYIIFAAVFGSLLISLGCIGTGLFLFVSGISYLFSRQVVITRPLTYLKNKEYSPGCMLVAAHENATTWTLYMGDRGMIGCLLNMPMVEIAETTALVRYWFRFAELFQVIVVTYIAGQKGWDGLFFLVLIMLCSLTRLRSCDKHAADWVKGAGFTTAVIRCDFPGRSELFGTVQLLGDMRNTLWMDTVVAPVMRRHVWLKAMAALKTKQSPDGSLQGEYGSLKAHEQDWVRATVMQALAAYELIQEKIQEQNSKEQKLTDDEGPVYPEI